MHTLPKRYPFPTTGLGPLPMPPEVRLQSVMAGVFALFEVIADIDERLVYIARLLDRSQPSASGKLSVRFRRARAKTSDGQTPVFVRWSRPPGSRAWHSKVLPPAGILRQAKSERLFAPTHHYVRPLLREARALMAQRASLLRIEESAHSGIRLNTGKARKLVAASSELYALLEPQIEASRAKALADYNEAKAEKVARYARAKS